MSRRGIPAASKLSAVQSGPPAGRQPFDPDPCPRLVSLLLALITVLVYLPVWHHGYIFFDDPSYVSETPWCKTGSPGCRMNLDCQLFGLNAGAQHLVNVLFNAGEQSMSDRYACLPAVGYFVVVAIQNRRRVSARRLPAIFRRVAAVVIMILRVVVTDHQRRFRTSVTNALTPSRP